MGEPKGDLAPKFPKGHVGGLPNPALMALVAATLLNGSLATSPPLLLNTVVCGAWSR